ncbi:Axonemal dynein light intermediate polypeptide 1 [Phytophthora cinnamomi]|uniref:Axonemal dynein light intermediate polypeptide 1 n=1 Tax=Phytophthora cinnamomi TaxID=4785 RepID=UPI0035598D5F|nr:Axonemal dynein light intermediate polypeptide 1 [Phytophthora cinnamomi]
MKSAANNRGSTDVSPSADTTSTTSVSFLHAKKRIGSKEAPVNYSFEERVFCPGDTAPDKAAAKLEVVEMLRSRILSAERPEWNISNSNWDNMQMAGKCYKRTNINAERNRAHMFAYNFRAEKLPIKNPTLKPKSNRFNTGILEVALKDEYVGEAFGNERVMKGIAKCTEELPNHPDLYDAKPWNQSVELTKSVRRDHFAVLEAARQTNSDKWRQKVGAKENYKNPEQLSKELSARKRQEKQDLVAAKSNQRH